MTQFKTTKIKTILFDWDMTLGAALGNVSRAERIAALFRCVDLEYTPEAVAIAMAKQKQVTNTNPQSPKKISQRRKVIATYYQHLLMHLGYTEASLALGKHLYDMYATLPFEFYPDTIPTLQSLAAKQLRLGIITNHSPKIRPVIEKRLHSFIAPEHINISGELNSYKPEAAIFIKAAARLKSPPEQCLYVGDNLKVDAIAAVTAGGYACGLWCNRSKQKAITPLPEHVHQISQLSEVLAWFIS